MRYISTRGDAAALNFADVLLTGLASDGGLYVPEFLPHFSVEKIESFRAMRYNELAFEVTFPFVEGSIEAHDFQKIVDETYAEDFAHRAIAPLTQLGQNDWFLSLFFGPTLAFKDFALQLLGRLLDHVLANNNEKVVILGATSGDTGSAAIEGCKRCENVDIFILHPHNRVSEVQRRQMTTVVSDNIFNVAVEGNFDDCQKLVKSSFRNQSFLHGKRRLVAVNSINWARIMAQIVYYFYAAVALGGPHRSVAFSVPTGNFGDIYAGYLAHNMGLPINQLVISTNTNDILHRFMSANQYEIQPIHHSLSPSMDISVSSNFERLLFDLHGRQGKLVATAMERMHQSGPSQIDELRWKQARALFDSYAVDDEKTLLTIRQIYQETGDVLDPHSAIGVAAARACRRDNATPMITLGTAHAAKFPDAVKRAGISGSASLPVHLEDLYQREEMFSVLPNSLEGLHKFIADSIHIAGDA